MITWRSAMIGVNFMAVTPASAERLPAFGNGEMSCGEYGKWAVSIIKRAQGKGCDVRRNNEWLDAPRHARWCLGQSPQSMQKGRSSILPASRIAARARASTSGRAAKIVLTKSPTAERRPDHGRRAEREHDAMGQQENRVLKIVAKILSAGLAVAFVAAASQNAAAMPNDPDQPAVKGQFYQQKGQPAVMYQYTDSL
ncbi:hypothetical protein A1351_02070 [Methylosinus sp. R-45379]|uniref:hypothetical protein n=1 Tax=unclassified Methylosinus TaxID=2624500 RepID=UPI000463B37C|nr:MULTISPECIES: hypothetical protein [unclassified Methylosinus]OAI26240.1 hypothetical protein A1351_02070 [Methylosinus sp. R-45379]